MKKIISNLVYFLVFTFAVTFFTACNDNENHIEIYKYRETIGQKIKEVTDLLETSEFGPRKGMYPEESKDILDEAKGMLIDLLQKIKEEAIPESEIPTRTSDTIEAVDDLIESFKSTIRTEDAIIKAELCVNGKNGGYINFGSHSEYSSFGENGKQKFTVDFWVKLNDLDGFFFLLSTFTDDESKDHERKGWCVNLWNMNLRMTYGIGYNDLMEPAYGFTYKDQWVHICSVTNEEGVDGELENGIPIMLKMYLNGEVVLKKASEHYPNKSYSSNDLPVPMVAFSGVNTAGNILHEKGANGLMKYMHIWKTAKNEEEVKQIMNNPEKISGKEEDLVCGWNFTTRAYDDSNIVDITGRYTASLHGDYKWIEIK